MAAVVAVLGEDQTFCCHSVPLGTFLCRVHYLVDCLFEAVVPRSEAIVAVEGLVF